MKTNIDTSVIKKEKIWKIRKNVVKHCFRILYDMLWIYYMETE